MENARAGAEGRGEEGIAARRREDEYQAGTLRGLTQP